MSAAYVELHRTGELQNRARIASARMRSCELCPHRCRVDRNRGEVGYCRIGRLAVVASAGPHFGEEPPLVGRGGSGTIFFAGCNLSCVFCQNHDISRLDQGREVDAGMLARHMLELQEVGCENINLVSPTHVIAPILEALVLAVGDGLELPLVYNSGGYDLVPTLRLLEGVVDIYLPDAKYVDEAVGRRLSEVTGYVAHNQAALLEMHRQVGDLETDERGVAVRGLLVRHLVLPGDLAGTERVMAFLAERVSGETRVNVMGQYRPCHRAREFPELSRRPSDNEIAAARRAARALGLHLID